MEVTPLCIVPNTYLETMCKEVEEQVSSYTKTVVNCNVEITTTPGKTHSWVNVTTDSRSLVMQLAVFTNAHLTANADIVY